MWPRRCGTPFSSLLLKKSLEFRPGSFPILPWAACSFGFFKGKKFAEVISLAVGHPFRRWLPAFIFRVFIIKMAVHAAVQVTPAMGADFLAPDYILAVNRFPAEATNLHLFIIHLRI
jgi:hypothetical protein